MTVQRRRAGTVSKEVYETQAAFRYALRQFLRFSETAARGVGLTPQQYQGLLAIQGFPGIALKSMPSSLRPNATRSRLTTRERQWGMAMDWPMPVDPRVSRRFSILNSIASAFSSSFSKPTSSFRTASLVVLWSWREIASSEKNSRSRTGEGLR